MVKLMPEKPEEEAAASAASSSSKLHAAKVMAPASKKTKKATKRYEHDKKEILQELVKQEFSTITDTPKTETRVDFRWSNRTTFPDCDEFVYIVSRDEPATDEKSEFDQNFTVGYIKDKRQYEQLLDLIRTLLVDKHAEEIDFETRIEILLNYQNNEPEFKRNKWLKNDAKFEHFIVDTIVKTIKFRENTLSMAMDENGAEFMENLLRPRIHAYVEHPSPSSKTQLQLELSLYELKFLATELFSVEAVERLERALVIFSLMHLMYIEHNRPWIHRAIFHTIELTARVLATNLQQRVWNLIGVDVVAAVAKEEEEEDCCHPRQFTHMNDAEHRHICTRIKPILKAFIRLGAVCMEENSGEMHCMERIRQCLTIFDFIENTIEKVIRIVDDLRDSSRDMTMNRSKLEHATIIVKLIWNTFEEGYFESSLESGNYETIKNVYTQLSNHLNRLKDALPPLDEYCLL